MNKQDAYLSDGGGNQIPDTIIVHCMGEYISDGNGGYDHAVPFLAKYKLSAHSLIAPDGTNYRCRHDNEIAWHARGFNTDSLGIEFLVPGNHDYGSFVEAIRTPYLTDDEYKEGVEQVKEWIELFNIKKIARHSEVSPGRKVDPGAGFPWGQFLNDVGFPNG